METEDLLIKLCKIEGTEDKIVCVLKDDEGYYLANYLTKQPIEHSRCLFWYIERDGLLCKAVKIDFPYYLIQFVCSCDYCRVDEPSKKCGYAGNT